MATGDFVALLDHDDVLAPHALYMVAHAINAHPDADVLYSDEDKLDAAGRRYDPYFKPDWNQELFYGQNFVNHLGVYRTASVRAAGGFRLGFEGSQDYDLALRLDCRHPRACRPHSSRSLSLANISRRCHSFLDTVRQRGSGREACHQGASRIARRAGHRHRRGGGQLPPRRLRGTRRMAEGERHRPDA